MGLTMTEKTLEMLRTEIAGCTLCELHKGRNSIVFGEGDSDAPIMLIGEGPGADEDREGKPFVGRSGNFLGKGLKRVGLERSSIYIANIVKCRPPNNRDPHAEEIATCGKFLDAQIAAIKPYVIVTLGRFAANYVSGNKGVSLSQLRKQDLVYGKIEGQKPIPIIPAYHPAFILRKIQDSKETGKSYVLQFLDDLKQAIAVSRSTAGKFSIRAGEHFDIPLGKLIIMECAKCECHWHHMADEDEVECPSCEEKVSLHNIWIGV